MAQKIYIKERGMIEIENMNVKCYLGKESNVKPSVDLFHQYKTGRPTKEQDYIYLGEEKYLILYPIPEKKISIIDNNGNKYKATVYFIDDIKNIIQGLNITNPYYLKDDSYFKIENEADYMLFLFGKKFKEIKDIRNKEIDFESLKEDYNSKMEFSLILKDINKNISHYSKINNIEKENYFITYERTFQTIALREFCRSEKRTEIEDIIYGIYGNYACGKSTFLMYFNYNCEFPSIYLNLKILNNAIKTTGFQNIFNNELMLLYKKLKKSFDEYKSFISQFLPYEKQELQSLIMLMIDKLKEQKIIIILDQYKEELFPQTNFISKLKSKLFEKDSKIKVIIASSIDNSDIRKTYFDLTFNKIHLKDEKTKEENRTNNFIPYNFIEKLIDDNEIKNEILINNKDNNNNGNKDNDKDNNNNNNGNKDNNNDNNNNNNGNKDTNKNNEEDNMKFENTLKLFNYLPLYYNLCRQYKNNLDKFVQETKERIEKKMTEFYDKIKVDLINLDGIRKILDNEVSELILKSYFKYIPFKYYYIEKVKDKFILRAHFPLIKDILINIIMKQTVNLFDGEIKYDGNIIGSLMELNLIINIKNKTIPLDIDSFCKVDEISEFKVLIEKDTKDFKDKNIFITQNKQNGAYFDLAYFKGKNNSKKLVYIQVKKSLSSNKVDLQQTKKIFKEKSKEFSNLFHVEPDECNLIYITIINDKIKKSLIAHDKYKKDRNKKVSDLGSEINSIVYSINSLESFCYEKYIQLYYYDPKTHNFYIKEKNNFINTELDLLKEIKSEFYIHINYDYLLKEIEENKIESEKINLKHKTFLNKKKKRKSEEFTYKIGEFDFNILFDFTKDYFLNTYIISYIDLHKSRFDMHIDNLSLKKAIICIKLKNQKQYIIDSFIYNNYKYKIENDTIIKINNRELDRDNDFIIIIGFDSILDSLKSL